MSINNPEIKEAFESVGRAIMYILLKYCDGKAELPFGSEEEMEKYVLRKKWDHDDKMLKLEVVRK